MAISDDLNSIRTHLEDDYKALEQLGVSVEDRNIENIKDMANQIYAKFPKTDYAEGSNITLSNCLKGKLDYEDDKVGYGDTKQETTTGKQLFNINSTPTLNSVIISIFNNVLTQTNTGSFCRSVWTISGLTIGTDYTFSYNFNNPNGCSIQSRLYDSTNNTDLNKRTSITTSTSGTQSITFSATETTHCIRMYSNTLNSSNTDSVIYDSILLEQGTTITSWEKYTGGISSPNPSYPQEIEVVRGKNLLNIKDNLVTTGAGLEAAYNNDGSFTLSGTTSSTSTWRYITNLINKELYIGTYTLSIQSALSFYIYIQLTFDDDTTSNKIITTGNKTITFDVLQHVKAYRIIIAQLTTSTQINERIYVQLEEGSQATSYLPYNTQEVVVRGKNVLDITAFLGTKIGVTTTKNANYLHFSGTPTRTNTGITVEIDITNKVSKFEKFTLSVNLISGSYPYIYRIVKRNSNDEVVDRYSSKLSSDPPTITVSNESGYKYGLVFMVQTNVELVNINCDLAVQIEEGDTATTYEPYITPITKQLSLGDIELAKIGNYKDYIYKNTTDNKWYKKNIVGKKIYSAINNFTNLGSYSRVSILFDTGKGASSSVTNSLSNVSIYKVAYSEQSNHQYASASAIYWFIQNSSIGETISKETIETYISSLSVTPEFYYVLATPTDTEITDTSLKEQLEEIYNMQSVNGTTIVETNGNLPMIIKCRALKGGE